MYNYDAQVTQGDLNLIYYLLKNFVKGIDQFNLMESENTCETGVYNITGNYNLIDDKLQPTSDINISITNPFQHCAYYLIVTAYEQGYTDGLDHKREIKYSILQNESTELSTSILLSDLESDEIISPTVRVEVVFKESIEPVTVVTLNSDKSSLVHGESVILSGYVETDGVRLANVDVGIYDGATLLDTVTTDSNGVFTESYELSLGNHSVKALYEETQSNAVSITVIPSYSLTLESNKQALYVDESVILSGSLLADNVGVSGQTIQIRNNTGLIDVITTDSNGDYEISIDGTDLSIGTNTLYAKTTTDSGDITTETITITVNLHNYALSIQSDKSSMLTTESAIITGVLTKDNVAFAGQTVNLYDGSTVIATLTTGSDGGYTETVSNLSVGTHSFKAVNTNAESSTISITVTEPSHDYALSVASTKDILSYADSESATVTGTLTDNGVAVAGETLSYSVKKGSTVISSGSGTTDSNGQVSMTYQSTGVGDVTVEFDFGVLLQERYDVQDCWFYGDMAKIKSSWTSDTSVSEHTGYAFDTTFTDDVEVSFKFKNSLPSRWLIGFAPAWVTYKAIYSQEANMWIYWTPTNSSSRTYERYNASKTVNSVFKLTTEDLHKITYTVDDVGAVTKETNSSLPLKFLVRENNSYPITFDYLKIKAL